eukprot:CAMPEP_0182821606 /NCGR_PEP_ID=MMETSP0006_2-20121128/13758_1 /TAXON_ID=97485 /ORGANISM="Prymnesium parvum, Strain Texoma1" /LENGTH=115 /DNA_ID=CAMNT_0024948371 /DNA_START=354 /DNA_END=701 /DNA_ORIENTATION=-
MSAAGSLHQAERTPPAHSKPSRIVQIQQRHVRLPVLLLDRSQMRVHEVPPGAGPAMIKVGNDCEQLVEPAVLLQQLLHERHAQREAAQLIHAREVDLPLRLPLGENQYRVGGLQH